MSLLAQEIVVIGIVGAAAAYLLWVFARFVKRMRDAGGSACGGGCSCPAKTRLARELRAARKRAPT